MKRGLALSAFVVVAIVQLLAPASMIIQREMTLRYGRAYKFRTAPVDPYDAFRGRYVWLGYEQNRAPWAGRADEIDVRNSAYGRIEEGKDGFAVITSVSLRPPETGDCVRVTQVYSEWQAGRATSVVRFTLPFDRFYMEESAAPKAEIAYRDHTNWRNQTNHNCYAMVRIRNGDAVLENLFVDGRPISEFVKQSAK